MPEVTRGLENLTIHFMGDNAGQIAATFDGAYSRSPRFQGEMADAASKHKDFYVGNSFDELVSAPGYGRIPRSRVPQDAQAFTIPGGPDSFFIVVSGAAHNLIQDGKSFMGTPLSSARDTLHAWVLFGKNKPGGIAPAFCFRQRAAQARG